MNTNLTLIVTVIIVLVVILMLWRSQNSRDSYGTVLGAAAPYRKILNQCYNQVEKQDSSRRLLSQANINGGVFCDYMVDRMAQLGIPPDAFPLNDIIKKCEKQCDVPGYSHNAKRKCVSVCSGQNEVVQWCKQLWSPYAPCDEERSAKICASVWNNNNNQVSWTWKMSR